MKKRLFAGLLTLVMIVSLVPMPALAVEDEPEVVPCTVTEGCTLAAGHEGECVTTPAEPEDGDSNGYYEFEDVTDGEDGIMPLGADDDTDNSCGAEGSSVTWALTVNNGNDENPTYTLTISGSGAMKDYAKNSTVATDAKPIYSSAPWWTSSLLSTAQVDADGTSYDGTYLTGITKIVVESGVTRIGSSAFSFMRDVTEIQIADSVTSIGDRAFMYNYSLENISIPDSVQMSDLAKWNDDEDGELLLAYCPKLKNVTLGTGFSVIPCRAFENTPITPNSITMDKSKVTGIGTRAFYQNENGIISVEELDLTGFTTLKTLCDYPFGNWSIKSLKLPSSIENIGIIEGDLKTVYGTFQNIADLTSVNWSDLNSLKQIAQSSFVGTSLVSVDLSDTKVESIGWHAFYNCSNLQNVILPNTVIGIGDAAFSGMADSSTIALSEEQFTLLTNKYSVDKTTIIIVGSTDLTGDKTIGLVHGESTTYFSSFASAANNAVSGDTIFATQSYTFAAGEVAIVKKGVSLTGGNLDGYGATYENGEITAYCDTLQTALANCSDGDTVKLNKDVSVSGNMNVFKNITIDLNEKTVTGTAWAAPFNIKDGVVCTIKNGKIQNSANGIYVDTQNNSVTTLSSVTFSKESGTGTEGIRVRNCTVVLSGVTMSSQQLYTVSGATPTVFFAGSNNSIVENVIDSNGTWSLYFDSSNTSILSSNKSNATRYFLTCAYSDLSSINPITREDKTLAWYDNESYNGTVVVSPEVNNAYYAKWDGCNHEGKSYTADNDVLTQTCATCGHVFGTATIVAPTELAYNNSAKEATVTISEGWSGDAPTPAYYSSNNELVGAPTDAGTYTAKIAAGDGNAAVTASVEFEITKAKPTINITADNTSLTGGGTVTLKVEKGGLPDSAEVTVTCDNTSYNPKLGTDGKYTVTLPNSNGTYKFTVNYTGDTNHESASKDCTVSVTRYTGGGGGGSSSGGSTSYTVSVDSTKNGTVSVSPKNASKGATVTITVKPNSGYELDDLTVTDKNGDTVRVKDQGNGKYTFTMPASKVTVEAAFAKIEEQPSVTFADISASAYYYDAVEWAVENGITNGTSATTFSPDATCTRAQTVTFLWRAAGSPAPKSSVNPFTDVQPGAYYYEAVLWAVENGITNGTSATTFSPDDTVTRGQTVTFQHRAAGSPAVGGGSFADVAADAYYAPAVQWAVANGITNGTSSTTFSPDAPCTRGQIVTFLYRDMAE